MRNSVVLCRLLNGTNGKRIGKESSMRSDYYPSFFEVYVETFYWSKYGRTYSTEQVVKRGLSEDEAESMVKELRPSYTGEAYVGKRKMKD